MKLLHLYHNCRMFVFKIFNVSSCRFSEVIALLYSVNFMVAMPHLVYVLRLLYDLF